MQNTAKASSAPRGIFLIPFLTDFSGMLLIFTVSRNLAELEVGLLAMGLIGAGHAIVSSISSFVCGNLSDRVGRTRLIIPGILTMFTSATICLLSPFGSGLFLSMYWVNALSLGMIHPPTIAWINTKEAKRSFSRGVSKNLIRFCIAWNLGILSSQLSGGWLFLLGAKTPLILSAGIALVNLGVVFLVRRHFLLSSGPVSEAAPSEAPSQKVAPPPERPSPGAFRGRAAAGDKTQKANGAACAVVDLSKTFVQLSWLANLGGAFAVSMIIHLFPQLAVSLGVPPNQHGFILAMMRVAVICVYLILHHSRFWQYRYTSTLVVQAAAIAGLLLLYFAENPWSLYVGVLGLALLIGFDYFSGIYYSTSGNEDKKRGFASGMHEASLGLGIAAGSAGGGIAGAFLGDRMPYLLAILVISLLTVFQLRLVIKRRLYKDKTAFAKFATGEESHED